MHSNMLNVHFQRNIFDLFGGIFINYVTQFRRILDDVLQ